jgi:excisionase family DNA binding protein
MSPHPAPDAPRPRRPGTLGGSNRMLSAEQVAEILGGGISAKTVLAYRHAWGLKSVKIGKHVRFRERDLNAWMDKRPEA